MLVFDQWIYGTEIPKYASSYETKEVNEKYQVYCCIKPEDVSENFKAYVPIEVNLGDNKVVKLKLLLSGKNSEIKLPLLPMELEEIIFIDMNSVLCDVDYKSYDRVF